MQIEVPIDRVRVSVRVRVVVKFLDVTSENTPVSFLLYNQFLLDDPKPNGRQFHAALRKVS